MLTRTERIDMRYKSESKHFQVMHEFIRGRTFKTIDSFINTYRHNKPSSLTTKSMIQIIIANYSDIILNIVKSNTNKPSKHDIIIIQTVNYFLTNTNGHSVNIHIKCLKPILNGYKNRKD